MYCPWSNIGKHTHMSVGTWEEEAAVSSAGNLVDEKESAGM